MHPTKKYEMIYHYQIYGKRATDCGNNHCILLGQKLLRK